MVVLVRIVGGGRWYWYTWSWLVVVGGLVIVGGGKCYVVYSIFCKKLVFVLLYLLSRQTCNIQLHEDLSITMQSMFCIRGVIQNKSHKKWEKSKRGRGVLKIKKSTIQNGDYFEIRGGGPKHFFGNCGTLSKLRGHPMEPKIDTARPISGDSW